MDLKSIMLGTPLEKSSPIPIKQPKNDALPKDIVEILVAKEEKKIDQQFKELLEEQPSIRKVKNFYKKWINELTVNLAKEEMDNLF